MKTSLSFGFLILCLNVFVSLIGWSALAQSTPPKPEVLKSQVLLAMKNERYFDAQTISLVGLTLFSDPAQKSRFGIWRAFALWKLGDLPESHRLLTDLPAEPFGEKIEFFRHWMTLQSGDQANFESWLLKKSSDLQGRSKIYLALSNEEKISVDSHSLKNLKTLNADKVSMSLDANRTLNDSIERLQSLDLQSPTTNGILSALLPGLGHARLGRYQDAALTFALNFISIAATAEFARKEMTWPALASGSLASLFYVGGISSAWRLTKERNAERKSIELRKIEPILFPELSLDF